MHMHIYKCGKLVRLLEQVDPRPCGGHVLPSMVGQYMYLWEWVWPLLATAVSYIGEVRWFIQHQHHTTWDALPGGDEEKRERGRNGIFWYIHLWQPLLISLIKMVAMNSDICNYCLITITDEAKSWCKGCTGDIIKYMYLFTRMSVTCMWNIPFYFAFHLLYSFPSNRNSTVWQMHTVKWLQVLKKKIIVQCSWELALPQVDPSSSTFFSVIVCTVHPRLSEPLWSGSCAKIFG